VDDTRDAGVEGRGVEECEMRRLEDKVAIVTGGAGGIGSATARRLASEGARVVVADIDLPQASEVAKGIGAQALALAYDAADVASIKELVEATVRHFGQLDILHNNAAITSPQVQAQDTTVVDIPFEIWDRTLQVNLKSYMAGCKYALPHMLARGGGAIINTASGSGSHGDLARVAYGTSKAAIINLTRYVATQHGRDGIRCNAISPGLILTAASEKAVPELLRMISEHVSTPRLGRPEDVAALVAFLASEDAGYINGENITCDGGMCAHQPHVADLRKYMKGELSK
jgi:NAD(P)-dependent dehydrogenase (short-subunit alcohol dehydrogenase family)